MSSQHRFVVPLMSLLVLAAFPALSAAPQPSDVLRIVSVVPTGDVSARDDVTFTFEVDVTLESADEAWLHLGFNDRDTPSAFRMVSQFLLRRGMERVTLTATLRPKDWGRNGEFAAFLAIGPREQGKAYTPTASVRHVIPVLP